MPSIWFGEGDGEQVWSAGAPEGSAFTWRVPPHGTFPGSDEAYDCRGERFSTHATTLAVLGAARPARTGAYLRGLATVGDLAT